jgi:CBS domain containing-hemolysin-like protein
MDAGRTPVILVIDRTGDFHGVITLSRVLAAIATAAGQDTPLVRRRLERDVLHTHDSG